MTISPAEWVGTVGVAMLLLAFVLLQLNRLEKGGTLYLSLNTIGAALACLSSYMIDFMPFVVLEGVWAVSSFIALTKVVFAQNTATGGYT